MEEKKTSGIYKAHRQNQREWILEAAEDLFIQRGVTQVTMADIAEASHVTRATLYQYFDNKQQITLEIYKIIMEEWREMFERRLQPFDGSGFEKLAEFASIFLGHILGNPREVRFISEFNYLSTRDIPSGQVHEILETYLGGHILNLIEMIRQGLADGSLRPELDPQLVLSALLNLNSSVLGRLGAMHNHLETGYAQAAERGFRELYRIFLVGLKNDFHPMAADPDRSAGLKSQQPNNLII